MRGLLLAMLMTGCTMRTEHDASVDVQSDASVDSGNVTDMGVATDAGDVRNTDVAFVCQSMDVPLVPSTPPPAPPVYSRGTCPRIVFGSTAATSRNENFATGQETRAFHVMVPSDYSPDREYPLLFAYHWLAGSAAQMIREGELETAVNRQKFIVVVPEALKGPTGDNVYGFVWPILAQQNPAGDLQFFSDMLSCVTEQLRVDRRRVHAVGVSAGALWVTYLSTTEHVKHLASVASLSGGLGYNPPAIAIRYATQPNKFPALVLWGGPRDQLLLNFQTASMAYRDALRCDQHFVVECTHDAGHAVPPLPVVDGGTRFESIWQFMLDHPFGLAPGESPYLDGGLPSAMPSWCSISR